MGDSLKRSESTISSRMNSIGSPSGDGSKQLRTSDTNKENRISELEADLKTINLNKTEAEEDHQIGESVIEDLYPDNDIQPDFEAKSAAINLAFPEYPEHGQQSCFPPSYYTLSAKEKLILFYAENFRRQYMSKYPLGRLVLAVPNECGVEKFVCTTIRPTGFVFTELINSIDNCASFVADYIIYEPLPNPIAVPSRLISPATLLKRRVGNSFEMATLLCSILIGSGFPAMVVSGTARHETTLNDQRDVVCPYIPKNKNAPKEESSDDDEPTEQPPKCKYELPDEPNTTNHLEEKLAKIAKARAKAAQRIKNEENRKIQEFLDTQSKDKYHNRRLHAWVVIIENAPWSIKPRKKSTDEDGNEIYEKPSAFFIEPSTGFRHSTYSKYFIHVDCIWHNENYYVNRQNCRPRDMDWDLSNLDNWEHFLPGEPTDMRIRQVNFEENLADYEQSMIYVERHLDLIRSWVMKLHINELDFKERYPNEKKIVFYKKCVHERFSPYSEKDGKIIQITLYDNHQYETPTIRWMIYENRSDFLYKIKIDFRSKEVEEDFYKGRKDCLKFYEHGVDFQRPKRFHFYHMPRLDSLELIETYRTRLILYYNQRHDKCYYREYSYKPEHVLDLMNLTELFRRNESIPADKDIAYRKFCLDEKKVLIKFHFAKNAITASSRDFILPPNPAYGQEYLFDPKLTTGYVADPTGPAPTQYELYKLLLEQLKYRKTIQKKFDDIMEEILGILELRQSENIKVRLLFSVFDSLHNSAAREMRMRKFEDEEKRLKLIEVNDPDFLAPYLVLYKSQPLTHEESMVAYNACLFDLKTRFVRLLNGLQTKYEDLTAEYKAIKKFLRKYQDQFDKFDYERLVQDVKDLELNKRMVQQRLEMTHEEAQRKYEKVKNSLDKDHRLEFRKPSILVKR